MTDAVLDQSVLSDVTPDLAVVISLQGSGPV